MKYLLLYLLLWAAKAALSKIKYSCGEIPLAKWNKTENGTIEYSYRDA